MALFGTDRRVLVLALARMADAVGNSFLIVVLPLYIASGRIPLVGLVDTHVFGVELTEALLVGIVLSLFGFLNSLGQPLAGRLSDRFGKRRVFILVGLVLLGVSSAAYALADSYSDVVILRIVQGFGVALTIPATVALVNELATTATRGGNFGVFNTFRLIGFGFGPLGAGVLLQYGPYELPFGTVSGFDAAFALAGAGAFLSFGLVWLLVSDPAETRAAAADEIAVSIAGEVGPGRLDPVFALGVASLFMAVTIGLFATLESPINDRLGQGPLMFATQFAAVTIANIGLQVPIGRASDAYGRRPFLLAGFVVLVPATLVQGFVTTPIAMLGARLLQGIAVGAVFAPSFALVGDLAREGHSGTQLSILTMSFGLGVAIGPLSSGYLVGFGFAYPFVFGAVLAVVGFFLVYTQVGETLDPAEPAAAASPGN